MESLFRTIVDCRDGLRFLGDASIGLPLSLFLVGLAGSVTHCIGMCGPFVLGQVMVDAQTAQPGRYGEWRRLSGAALVPYQLGRFTTYTLLGALAGGATAIFTASAGFGWLAGVLLLVASALMAGQALGYALTGAPFAIGLSRLASPLVRSRAPWARYALGLVLGFLPCGLLYGAVAAAAGTASPVTGALAMSAFAVGTVPALVGVGWLGTIVRRRLQNVRRWVAVPLLLVNAVLMAALAAQRF